MYSLILHGKRSCLEVGKLRLVLSAFSNSLSFATTTAANVNPPRKRREGKNSYPIGSLGLSKKVNLDSVVNLFRTHKFTDSQISTIIETYPKLLMISDAENSLTPKLMFLKSRGASTSELTEIISKVPKILGIKKDKALSRYYDFVKEIVEADKSSSSKFISLPEGGCPQENKLRNLSVLRELGVPQKTLFTILFSSFHNVFGKEKFQESLKKVVGMGFDPTSNNFVRALRILQGHSDKTIERRFSVVCEKLGFETEDAWEIYKRAPLQILGYSEKKIINSIETFLGLGFSRDECKMLVKRFPECLGYSTETVKRKTEFIVKEMKWRLEEVVLFPQVFGCSMEKRIVPRCNVIKALISKGLIVSERPSLSSILACTDQTFLKKFVSKREEDKELVSELMAIFTKR